MYTREETEHVVILRKCRLYTAVFEQDHHYCTDK